MIGMGKLLDPQKRPLIAGPCSLESEEICREVADVLQQIARRQPHWQVIFKGSFDKANRTSVHSPRGAGLEKGLALLRGIREEYGFPVLTDIHETSQAAPVAEVCDILQIPAFLCRQTDLLTAAAATGRVVNVKKGQFLSPRDMPHVVGKLEESAAREIWLTERGSSFGYQNLVVDMRSFPLLRELGHPVIFDVTHSVQLPGGGEGQSTGQREFTLPLARAALAAGADGLFLETHPRPGEALSDGPNMIPTAELEEWLQAVAKPWL